MDDELLACVRQLKIDQPTLTAKEIHLALSTAGNLVEFSAVKKACSKVAKALAQEAAVPAPPEEPTLVSAPIGAVAFVRCQCCQQRLKRVRVCAGCCCVAYCSVACQAADHDHHSECASYLRHMKRDVSVRLPGDPAWLRGAMDHRADMEMCELLQSLGLHDGYGVLCGCVRPSAPHRYAPEPDGLASLSEAMASATASTDRLPEGWAEAYVALNLQPCSPLALLLSWPLTVHARL